MSIDVKFSFVCSKTFDELEGDSQTKRFCRDCQFEVVNLDALDDKERFEIFETAAGASRRPVCVWATVPVANRRDCPSTPAWSSPEVKQESLSIAMGGYILPPTHPELESERKRIAQQNSDESNKNIFLRFLSKLKFWSR